MPKSIIIVPTYNEIESLPKMINEVFKLVPDVDLLVVDDNSPDGTGQWADEKAKSDKRVKVIHREKKNGLGPAYIEGFQWANSQNYDYMIEMDADLSHRPKDLVKLLEKAYSDNSIDLVIGSRWVKGGGTKNWSFKRIMLSKMGSLWSRFWLGLSIRDITAGFRVYSKKALFEKIDLSKIDASGFGFQIDMTFNLSLARGSIVEVPILFVERELGVSKISNDIVTEALMMVVKKGLNKGKLKRKLEK